MSTAFGSRRVQKGQVSAQPHAMGQKMASQSVMIREELARANLADRIYLVWFLAANVFIAWRDERVTNAGVILLVNAICFLAVIFMLRMAPRSGAWSFVHDWYPMGMFIVCFEQVARMSHLFREGWQDHYLLAFEARWFPEAPTVWLGRHGSPWLTEILEIGYFSYFVILMIVGGIFYATRRKQEFRQVMDATVLSYLLCYMVFLTFPTEGPAHTLSAAHNFPLAGGGPFHWMVEFIQTTAGVHGNAFPSLHVAGAMVSLYFAWRYVPRLGLWLTPIVLLLCVGAVYDRYHYVSDVMAGIVFGVLPAWLVSRGWGGSAVPALGRGRR